MNPTCPKNGKLCMLCEKPCAAPEVNALATTIPEEPPTPFQGILATFGKVTDTVQASTNFSDKATISVKVKL